MKAERLRTVRTFRQQTETIRRQNDRRAVVTSLAALLLCLAGCGSVSRGSSPTSPPTSSTAPEPKVTSLSTPAAKSPTIPTLVLLACLPGRAGWSEINPATGSVFADIQSGDCSGYPTSELASNNPPTGTLYAISPNLRFVATWQNPSGQVNLTGGPSIGGQHAGYFPVGDASSNSFVDESGASSKDFSQTEVQDAQTLFNPVTGDEWWERNGHLFSNTVPPGTPVDHGPGLLYTFTPNGQPMPLPYFDSPSGKTRVIVGNGDGYNGALAYGPASSLTPQCLQHAGVDPYGDPWPASLCGSTYSQADAAACWSETDNTSFAGLADDTKAVCYAIGGTQIAAVPLEPSSADQNPPAGIQLIPNTTQEIVAALVTPDGSTVYFLAASGTSGLRLYKVPTDGSGATVGPTLVRNFGASSTGAGFAGWLLKGKRVI